MKQKIIVITVLVETSPQAVPQGAACIVSMLRNNVNISKRCDISLKDYSLEKDISANNNLSIEEKLKLLAQKISLETMIENPYAVCFSMYVWNRKILCDVAEIIKNKKPETILIAGGPEITAMASVEGKALELEKEFTKDDLKSASSISSRNFNNIFNFILPGQGELSIVQLFSLLLEQKLEVPKSTLVVPPIYGKIEELSSPILDGTLEIEKYGGVLWELARGCPFSCSYCYESKGHKKIQYFPMERLIAELKKIEQSDVSQVFVLDPTYNADKKRALLLLETINKIAPDIHFHFEARAEYLDYPLANAFSKMNASVQIGLQSSDEKVLSLVNRKFNKDIFEDKIALLNQTGAVFGFDLIYGLPGDSLSGYKKSLDFAFSLYPNSVELFRLSVLPGTDLYDRSKELGLSFEENPPYHVISTKTFSKEDLFEAEIISKAAMIFYSAGRAVPWFCSILDLLNMRASEFIIAFKNYLNNIKFNLDIDCNLIGHKEIEKHQLIFVEKLLQEKKKQKYYLLISDIIRIYGSLSRATIEKETEILDLSFYPDDLLSEYTSDIDYCFSEMEKYQCSIKVFPNSTDADYSIINKKAHR